MHGRLIKRQFTSPPAFSRAIITPTIAGGKGWGTGDAGFNIQSTLGVSTSVADEKSVGTTTTWNTSLQTHIDKLCPEIETNYTSYHEGEHAGKSGGADGRSQRRPIRARAACALDSWAWL
jgi:hypothetical protein